MRVEDKKQSVGVGESGGSYEPSTGCRVTGDMWRVRPRRVYGFHVRSGQLKETLRRIEREEDDYWRRPLFWYQ